MKRGNCQLTVAPTVRLQSSRCRLSTVVTTHTSNRHWMRFAKSCAAIFQSAEIMSIYTNIECFKSPHSKSVFNKINPEDIYYWFTILFFEVILIWLESRQNFLSNKLHLSRHSFLNLREEQVFQRYWFGKQTVLDLCEKLKWICSVRGRRTLLWSSCQCHLCIRFSGNKWTCKSWGHYLYQLVFNVKFTNQCTDDTQKKSINSS